MPAMASLRGEPARAFLKDLADPVKGFEVVLQCGPAEQANLGHIGRTQPGHAALAFDRFDHGGLFAADVRAGAAPQLDFRQPWHGRVGMQAAQRFAKHRAASGVFVAQVDVDCADLGHRGGDQHAFEEAMRIALQVGAILEGAGLALIQVDCHQARGRLGHHDPPFAPGGETRAAQAAQAGILHRAQHGFCIALS